MHDPSRTPYAPLLEGCRAGHHSLPADLLAAYRALDLVRDQRARHRQEAALVAPSVLAERLGALLVETLGDGTAVVPEDFLDGLEDAERQQRRRAFAEQVLGLAEEHAWRRLLDTMAGAGDIIVRDHLAVALSETMEAVRADAAKLGDLDVTSTEARLRAPRGQAEGRPALDAHLVRYRALHTARRHVHTLTGGSLRNINDLFGEVRNIRALSGDRWRGHRISPWRPWPDDPLLRLVWLATSEAEPWMPTPNEQDDWWLDQTADTRPGAQRARRTNFVTA